MKQTKKQALKIKRLRDENDSKYVKTMFTVLLYLLLAATAAGSAIYMQFGTSILVVPFSFALGMIVAGPPFAYSILLVYRD